MSGAPSARFLPVLLLAFAISLTRPARGDEYLERWTPGGDANAADLPYPHRIGPYESETDKDWVDGRWQSTKKGPFLSHSTLLPGYEVGPKLIAVDAGAGKHLLYDITGGGFVAGVTSGRVRTDPARFGLLNRPILEGEVAFFVDARGLWRIGGEAQPADASQIDYQGLYLHDDRVLLVTHVAETEVSESAVTSDDGDFIIREVEVGPRDEDLRLTVCHAGDSRAVELREGECNWTDKDGRRRRLRILDASAGVELEARGAACDVLFPASQSAGSVRLIYGAQPEEGRTLPSGEVSLAPLRTPGAARWGEPLRTKGIVAENENLPYVVDRIAVPHENRHNALFFIAGLAFFSNGDAAVGTAHGDVWLVRGLDASLRNVTWRRFATGLYQPLGLEIVDDVVYVLGRDQITRLHDKNQDGEADFYESFNHDLIIHGWPHAYAMRLERDPEGNFLFLKSGDPPHGSSLLRVSRDGSSLEVLARGFRHPFGLGVGPAGQVTVADNEGNWVPSSKIDLIAAGGEYGFLGSAAEQGEASRPARPLCFIPKVADNSSGGQFWHTSPRWGDYHRNEMFHLSWGRCTMHAVLRQQVGDIWQAATVEVPGVRFSSGPAEAAFGPHDGDLYVVGLDGWQTAAQADGSLERVRSTGRAVRLPARFAAHADGLFLEFSEPLDPESAADVSRYNVEEWNYRWGPHYGSFHYCVSDPKRVGHDKLTVSKAHLSADGKRLFLEIDQLCPVDQLQVSYDIRSAEGARVAGNLYGTLNALAPPHFPPRAAKLLERSNLVAWCIVPFDAKKRNSEERAEMLRRLDISRIAYDWRDEHIPTFDEELEAYKKYGIELHAFWMPIGTKTPLAEAHWPVVLDLLKRHRLSPELWVMLNDGLLAEVPPPERASLAADLIAPAAEAAEAIGSKIALYNHGSWFGEPENQIAIIQTLEKRNIRNVGIVYNFHHGHDHAHDFGALARRMVPYLTTVNVSGIRVGGPKILPFGSGDREAAMLGDLVRAGYRGPIGVLGHREELDAEDALLRNLQGFEALSPEKAEP